MTSFKASTLLKDNPLIEKCVFVVDRKDLDRQTREEERYSKRISTERIVDEGYNLNISRYISTAVQEKEIDLTATHHELVEIEKAIRNAATKHNEFLKELGLPPLPSASSN